MAQMTGAGSSRLISLDVFRGATIALMVLVNNGGGPQSYSALQHSEWNGWTITDTVFPSFLWMVGVAITLSLRKRLDAGIPKGRLILQVLRRAAILYILGLLIYMYPAFNLSTQRVLGVLQRIAICYLIASLIYLFTGVRGQIVCIVVLMASYWLLMTQVPVPGFGAGHLDVAGNFAHYVDSIVLGVHNYAETKTWDPEGIVSTLPAIATVLLGIMAGHILRLQKPLSERITWLFVAGNLFIALGLIVDIWLPINKKLWTDSFAFFMAGLDFVVLAISMWFVDGLGFHKYLKPLLILGMNAVAAYVASEVLAEVLDGIRFHSAQGTISLQQWLYRACLQVASPVNASLLYAVCFVLCIYVFAYLLHKRGWFLRV